MNDLISRQAAIDALDVLCQEHRYKIPGKRETYSQYNEAWQDALDRAEGAIFNLPSAQPDTDEWCHDCKEYDQEKHCCPRWNRVIRQTLKDAQTEIIRCKDCKHSEHWYRDKARCFLWHEEGIDVFEDGYCNYAERKTDATD